MKTIKVNVRGGFSDRTGLKPVNNQMQTDFLDERTRIALINTTNNIYNHVFNDQSIYPFGVYGYEKAQLFIKDVEANVFMQIVDYNESVSYKESSFFRQINDVIIKDEYDDVLTLIEYMAKGFNKALEEIYIMENICDVYNLLFEKECVGYRFIEGIITDITSNEEMTDLRETLKIPYDNVRKHLQKAMEKLYDKDYPDYENSIKESISAVEAMCELILSRKGSLGEMLKQIEKDNRVSMHPSLKEAFIKLYGYTSDSDAGIRHAASLGGSDATFPEARFMLVSCSAFINYLKASLAMPKN